MGSIFFNIASNVRKTDQKVYIKIEKNRKGVQENVAIFYKSYNIVQNNAVSPNASSILNNWLYFAILSEREVDPVLI